MIQPAQTGVTRSWLFGIGSRFRPVVAAILLAPSLCASGVMALPQAPAAPARAADDDTERARLLGLLVYTEVTITFNTAPARQAFDRFRQVTGIPIVALWNYDAVAFGLDPAVPISLNATARPALDVLEEMLEQCEIYEDCTWQLRKGFVEVGTKERLSVPAARETRLYDIRHLMIEPPMFAPPQNGAGIESQRKYNSAFTDSCAKMVQQENGEWVFRKNSDELAAEIVTAVVETIEPGMWDVGQETDDARADEMKDPGPGAAATPSSAAPVPAAKSAAPASPATKPLPRARGGVGKWASLRVWRDQVIIKAPDFMHRQINGYPAPIKPEGDLRRVADPNARGMPGDDSPTFDESKDAPRAVTPALPGDTSPPADASDPHRPQGEPIDPPKSPGDRKSPNRPH